MKLSQGAMTMLMIFGLKGTARRADYDEISATYIVELAMAKYIEVVAGAMSLTDAGHAAIDRALATMQPT